MLKLVVSMCEFFFLSNYKIILPEKGEREERADSSSDSCDNSILCLLLIVGGKNCMVSYNCPVLN